jgi:hypothetical protein
MKITKDFRCIDGSWAKSLTVDGEQYHTKSYTLWHSIKYRCIKGGCVQTRSPRYVGCFISKNFLDFQYFADWLNRQEGYGIADYQLDKDILVSGNKCYGEDTCVLIPRQLNQFLALSHARRGKWPLGVRYDKNARKYRASVSKSGGWCHLGCFDTPEDAALAYKVGKEAEAYRWYERLTAGEFVVAQVVIERMKTWRLEES